MNELCEIRSLELGVAAEMAQLAAVAEVLADAIPHDKAKQDAYKILAYLAHKTVERPDRGTTPKFSTKEIHTDLEGNPNREPSAWMSPLWKSIERDIYPELERALQDKAALRGLSAYPRVRKCEGSPAYYFVEAAALPDDVRRGIVSRRELPVGAIQYSADLYPRLSGIGALILKGGLSWTRAKRWTWVSLWLVLLFAALGIAIVSWRALSFDIAPLSARGTLTIAGIFLIPAGILWQIERAFRIFDDRVVLAPEYMIGLRERGVTLQIDRSPNGRIPDAIRPVRYTSTCPVCGAMVRIDRGEPDFPRRLVGRCDESPREHVFGFDRVTLTGATLRRPPVDAT